MAGDVTSVSIRGVTASSINTINPTRIVVVMGAGASPGVGDVVTTSISFGVGNGTGLYTVNPTGIIASNGVSPNNGKLVGGTEITITGVGLGSGSDITAVTVCGVAVSSIVSQTATQVVVVTASRGSATTGMAVVSSVAFGVAIGGNYTYNPSPMLSSVDPADGTYHIFCNAD